MGIRRQRAAAGRIDPVVRTWSLLSRSAATTEQIGCLLGESLHGGDVIALYGDLGAGKTVLVKGLALGVGAPPRQVSSPTFVLVNEYAGRLRLAHADLYRLDDPSALHGVGLWEYADDRAALAIEWADKAGTELPHDRLDVRLSHRSPRSRQLSLAATGAASQRLLARFTNRYDRRSRRAARAR